MKKKWMSILWIAVLFAGCQSLPPSPQNGGVVAGRGGGMIFSDWFHW
ncbi:MAG: hypothetical protein HQM03_12105 [Magnetococcales bacterium]|nr:hypothetical protein [Magnetococcales bacterium]